MTGIESLEVELGRGNCLAMCQSIYTRLHLQPEGTVQTRPRRVCKRLYYPLVCTEFAQRAGNGIRSLTSQPGDH